MRNLKEQEKIWLQNLTKYSARIQSGYYRFQPRNKKYGNTKYKRGRVLLMLHLGKWLERWELVCHKDGDKLNDAIENLEVLNNSEHNAKHHNLNNQSKPEGWKPVNTTPKETIDKIKQIANHMVKINCSEISRILKKEGISITSFTIKRYL